MYLETGLRLRALLALNVGDLQHERVLGSGGKLVFLGSAVVRGKGKKQRVVYFTGHTWKPLAAYLKRRRVTARSPLFVSVRGRRLSPRGVEDRLTTWCRRLGLEHIHVHQLRHSFATALVRRGVQLQIVQQLLGHERISTTCRYVAVGDAEVRRAYEKAMGAG
jgi:site-specific recombinase XerD